MEKLKTRIEAAWAGQSTPEAAWAAAQDEIEAAQPEGPLPGGRLMWQQLEERAGNYRSLQSQGDEYGLMFHLRSELMRRQVDCCGD